MNNVISFPQQVVRQAIRRMAHAAAAAGVPIVQANRFPPDSAEYRHMEHDYLEYERDRDLAAVG